MCIRDSNSRFTEKICKPGRKAVKFIFRNATNRSLILLTCHVESDSRDDGMFVERAGVRVFVSLSLIIRRPVGRVSEFVLIPGMLVLKQFCTTILSRAVLYTQTSVT